MAESIVPCPIKAFLFGIFTIPDLYRIENKTILYIESEILKSSV